MRKHTFNYELVFSHLTTFLLATMSSEDLHVPPEVDLCLPAAQHTLLQAPRARVWRRGASGQLCGRGHTGDGGGLPLLPDWATKEGAGRPGGLTPGQREGRAP